MNEDLDYAREILGTEAKAIDLARDQLGDSFLKAVELVGSCEGQVVVTGLGKSGIVFIDNDPTHKLAKVAIYRKDGNNRNHETGKSEQCSNQEFYPPFFPFKWIEYSWLNALEADVGCH